MGTLAMQNGYTGRLGMPLACALTSAREAAVAAPEEVAEKRRLLLLVRVALTVGVASLLLYENRNPATWQIILALTFVGSNAVVAVLPRWVLGMMAFDVGVVLVDTAVTSLAMYATPQAGTDLLLLYFAIILMASVGDRLVLNVLACVVTSLAYFLFLLSRHAPAEIFHSTVLLRFPFLLIVGAFYGFFVDRTRRAREAAQRAASRQRARTEFLASLTADIKGPLEIAQRSSGILRDCLQKGRDEPAQKLAEQVVLSLRMVSDLVGLVPHEGAPEEA
jgi:K+-sensing histidine kinase KdpD